MRWALAAACLFACGSRSDLSPPPSLDASVIEASSQDVAGDVVAALDAKGPVAFLDGLGYVNAIVVDDANVYFSNYYPFEPSPTIGQGILSCSKSGCNEHPTLLVAQNANRGQLIVDATNLYWPSGHDVASCGLSGCGQPSTLTAAFSDVVGNAVAGNLLAFTVNAYYHGTVNVCSMPGCTSPTMIADGQIAPAYVTFDATNVYWTNTIASGGTVMQCALSGCNDSPTVLADGEGDPVGIAVDDSAVYWTAPTGLNKCAIGGCDKHPTIVGAFGGRRIVVDGGWVYGWGAQGIVKCPVSGCSGAPVPVTPPSLEQITDFAIDGTYVWYALSVSDSMHPFGGQILKAPK